jgi:hypothetical protein
MESTMKKVIIFKKKEKIINQLPKKHFLSNIKKIAIGGKYDYNN